MKIVVLAGGISPERDVSLCSGAKISNALRNKGHKVVLIDLFLGIENVDNIDKIFVDKSSGIVDKYEIPENPPKLSEIKEKRRDKSNALIGPNVLEVCRAADKVFIALHGACGEDGRLQALLDMYGVKYTGSDYISCGIAMDKDVTKRFLRDAGVQNAEWLIWNRSLTADYIVEKLGLPVVIKPCTGGSSIGVSIAKSLEELNQELINVEKLEGKVMIEEYIEGREFSVGMLKGNALPPIEIIPLTGFYDYKNKYQANLTKEICPAELDEIETNTVMEIAKKVHDTIGLGTYSRTDVIRRGYNDFWVLEVNTLPGMTPMSLLPQEAKVEGIDYETLCNMIVGGE